MLNEILAALGVALIAGGESFTFLGGLDALLFWGEDTLHQWSGVVALALSLLIAVFRHVLRTELDLLAQS